jgi:hypothetical protein
VVQTAQVTEALSCIKLHNGQLKSKLYWYPNYREITAYKLIDFDSSARK